MSLDALEADILWSVEWARAMGYRVAPYYPLLDSREGALCPLEALAGKPLGEAGLAQACGMSRAAVFEFTLGADGGAAIGDPYCELGRRIARAL
jgi:hypothetical protein